jgi:hypothetical protein
MNAETVPMIEDHILSLFVEGAVPVNDANAEDIQNLICLTEFSLCHTAGINSKGNQNVFEGEDAPLAVVYLAVVSLILFFFELSWSFEVSHVYCHFTTLFYMFVVQKVFELLPLRFVVCCNGNLTNEQNIPLVSHRNAGLADFASGDVAKAPHPLTFLHHGPCNPIAANAFLDHHLARKDISVG